MEWLQKIIDNVLHEMSKTEILMMTPADVPKAMQDHSIRKIDDWSGWKPIKSTITDSTIDKLEKDIGFSLPLTYREFLKTKYFFKLKIPDRAVQFPEFLPDQELSFLGERVSNMLESELVIGRGYIYFADFEDHGLLCFNANEKVENNEYPIVYIDHEDLNDIHLYANNFRELMEADEEHGNRFIDSLNDYHN